MKLLLNLLAGTFILSVFSPSVSAASLQGVGLAAGPTIRNRDAAGFHYQLHDAEIIHDTIRLTNTEKVAKTIDVNVVPATYNENGTVTCASIQARTVQNILLSTRSVSVPPEGTLLVPFTLTASAKLSQHEWQACVVAQESSTKVSGSGIPLTTRLAMRMSIVPDHTVPPSVTITTPRFLSVKDDLRLQTTVSNQRHASARIQLHITATNMFGNTMHVKPIRAFLLPDGTKRFDRPVIRRPFWGGIYKVTIRAESHNAVEGWLTKSPASQSSAKKIFIVAPQPPALLIIGFGLLTAGALCILLIKKKLR